MQKKLTYPLFILTLVLINLYSCSSFVCGSSSLWNRKHQSAIYNYSMGVLLRLDGKIEEATNELKQAVAADPACLIYN